MLVTVVSMPPQTSSDNHFLKFEILQEEAESHSATQPEDTTAQSSKAKVLSEAPTEESPKENEE